MSTAPRVELIKAGGMNRQEDLIDPIPTAGSEIEYYIDWLRDTLADTEYGKVGIQFDVVDGQITRIEETATRSIKMVKRLDRRG